MKKRIAVLAFCLVVPFSFAREYHVSTSGNDAAIGNPETPLRTINRAAQLAMPGDTVTVHGGTYREWVNPLYGGYDDARRILYRTADGETVDLKGSEPVTEWKKEKDGIWKTVIPNSLFGDYNPFNDKITGDWFSDYGRVHHTAEVYLNDVSLYEMTSRDAVVKDTVFSRRDPKGSRLLWYAEVDSENTILYANFETFDPRREMVEVTARPTCFYPTREGINWITLRGFRISQAATQWAAPTAEQVGMIGAHWCKGWIIENNIIKNSRCNGISLGKQCSTGHNLWTLRKFDGATEYIEVTMNAIRKGWDRENVGSHIIRNNDISNCEQTGICGSMGAAFSEIYGNHIHNIWVKQQFSGAEISGIKFHAAIDCYIHDNRIHFSPKGVWMDWMAQGSRISGNLFYDNVEMDVFYEVDHGPFVCDNNIMLSNNSILDESEGGAYIHNLIYGQINAWGTYRYTPYHLAHSTQIKGLYNFKLGDNRFFNNIICRHDKGKYGFDAYTKDNLAYPNIMDDNAVCETLKASIEEDGDKVYLVISTPEKIGKGKLVDGCRLGITRLSNYPYENRDGSPILIDRDFSRNLRSETSPQIGPFESLYDGKIQVW